MKRTRIRRSWSVTATNGGEGQADQSKRTISRFACFVFYRDRFPKMCSSPNYTFRLIPNISSKQLDVVLLLPIHNVLNIKKALWIPDPKSLISLLVPARGLEPPRGLPTRF